MIFPHVKGIKLAINFMSFASTHGREVGYGLLQQIFRKKVYTLRFTRCELLFPKL